MLMLSLAWELHLRTLEIGDQYVFLASVGNSKTTFYTILCGCSLSTARDPLSPDDDVCLPLSPGPEDQLSRFWED